MIRASFGKSVARSMLIGGLALLAVPAIAGCEAGLDAPTLEYHHSGGGAYSTPSPGTTPGPISISNAFVLGAPSGSSLPAGSSAGVFLALFNTGTSPDQLVGVDAPGTASSVEIKGNSAAVPANGPANLTGPEPSVILQGLTRQLQNGQTVKLQFHFASAGEIDLNVPVQAQSDYYATYSPPAPSPTATPTGTALPAAAASGTASATPGASVSPSTTPSPGASK